MTFVFFSVIVSPLHWTPPARLHSNWRIKCIFARRRVCVGHDWSATEDKRQQLKFLLLFQSCLEVGQVFGRFKNHVHIHLLNSNEWLSLFLVLAGWRSQLKSQRLSFLWMNFRWTRLIGHLHSMNTSLSSVISDAFAISLGSTAVQASTTWFSFVSRLLLFVIDVFK